MLAIPSAHGKNCVIPFCSASFRSFSGLIPPVLMDANILLSQRLYFSLRMRPLHPTLDFHADNKETNCADLKYMKQKRPLYDWTEMSCRINSPSSYSNNFWPKVTLFPDTFFLGVGGLLYSFKIILWRLHWVPIIESKEKQVALPPMTLKRISWSKWPNRTRIQKEYLHLYKLKQY